MNGVGNMVANPIYPTYKVFTAMGRDLMEGTRLEDFEIKSLTKTTSHQVICIGEEGRNRQLGLIRVDGYSPEKHGEDFVLKFGSLTEPHPGNFRIGIADSPNTFTDAIVVFRTEIGFRGGNSHFTDDGEGLPGKTLAKGKIAQGAAGYMGSGHQYVQLLPAHQIVGVQLSGRLYGMPNVFYYEFDGETLICQTQQERNLFGMPSDRKGWIK